MTVEETSALLAELFESYGLSSSASAGLAGLVVELGELRARSVLVEKLSPLRGSRFGWCLLKEFGDVESTKAAARRLRCSARQLHRHRQEIRRLLNGVAPSANVTT